MQEYPFRAIGGSFGIDDGQNVSVLGLLLGALTTREAALLLIDGIYLMTASPTAVTGVGVQMNVRRLSALSSGTAGVVSLLNRQHKEAQAFLADHVTCATGGTTTAIDTLGYRLVNNDEASLTGQADIVERAIWKPARPDSPLVLNRGEGVDLFQITASTAGAWNPEIAGRLVLQ